MDARTTLDRLDGLQAGILPLLDRKERLVRADTKDIAALTAIRWELTRLIIAYQMFKHREIFDPAAQWGSPDQARRARLLKADCIAAGENFRAYTIAWPLSVATERWDSYKPAALDMVAAIRAHLAVERRESQDLAGLRPTKRAA